MPAAQEGRFMNRAILRGAIAGTAVLTLMGASAATAVASNSAAGASAKPATCHSGTILTGIHGTVTIPKGNYCELLQATIVGNVIAQSGAVQLGIDNSQVSGRISATGITDNGWICGSRIGGDVVVTSSVSNPDVQFSPGTWDIGYADPGYCGNTQFDPVPGNAIGGDLKFKNNASGGELSNNDIEHALNCSGNTPSPAGSNNQVDEHATGQCASLAGGVDNDTTSPGDND
jgi:hypothetical protein